MSLFASLDVANPIASQSGALLAPVKSVDLGCNTGNSTHLQNTIVQSGLGRKSKRSKTRRSKTRRVRKNKKSGKTGKRKYKRTMNRRRKRSRVSGKTKSKSSRRGTRKGTRKNKRVRVSQVGRGTSYTNVLTPMIGMGPHAARSDVALANTGAISDPVLNIA